MLKCNNFRFERILTAFMIFYLLVCTGNGFTSLLQNRHTGKGTEALTTQNAHNVLPGEEAGTVAAETTLSINASKEIHPFRAGMRGANLGNWTFFWSRPYPNDSPKLRELTKLIKPGVLRYAGGLLSNDVTWDRNNTQCYPGRMKDGVWCDRRYYNPRWDGWDKSGRTTVLVPGAYKLGYQADEIDALAAFAEYVDAAVMIEVNITTCDPELWADMVRYTNVEHDYHFKYWELGNELDLERARYKPDVPVGKEYVSRFKMYHRAMKAVDGSIRIVGPTTAAHEKDNYFRAFSDFIKPLTKDKEIRKKQMLDVFSYHHYPLWNGGGNDVGYREMFDYHHSTEMRSRKHINDCADGKQKLLNKRGFENVPIAVTEFNAIAADTYTTLLFNHANALYMADTLGRQAYAGADMVLHWELYDDTSDTSFGLIDSGNSTISFNPQTGKTSVVDNFSPMPVYYAYFLYAQFFGDLMVESSSSLESRISVWASIDSADPNRLKLMVTNLGDEAISATIKIAGFNPSAGKYYEMTNESFTAASDKTSVTDGTYINGLDIDYSSVRAIKDSAKAIVDSGKALGEVGESFSHIFPAHSATAVILDGPKANRIKTPKKLKARRRKGGRIRLKWRDRSANEDGFKIERREEKNGDWEEIAETAADTRTFTDTHLAPGKTFFYRIRAFNSSAAAYFSVYSNVARAKVK